MLLHLQRNWFPDPDSYRDGIKMGIRCNSGAIPVAVTGLEKPSTGFSGSFKIRHCFFIKWEGAEVNLKPEDLPFALN